MSSGSGRARRRHLRSAADHHVIRYGGIDGSFAADITVDADAVVINYSAITRPLSGSARPPRSAEH